MAKEQFFYPETQTLFKSLETLRQRSSVSRGQAFEDFLTAVVCALAAETMESQYLSMVERHKKGNAGKRGIDLIAEMLGQLVLAMEQNDADILGDLFQGAITYGENGLYLTPDAITQLMAQLTVQGDEQSEGQPSKLINDCCCGTGRMLLEASKLSTDAELVGQDIDARCARITAINLGLRGKYGWVVCGNTLSGETQFAYRIGHFYHESPHGLRRGVIREVAPTDAPVPVIAERRRQPVEACFQDHEKPKPAPADATELPTIIEIPRWLARLESPSPTSPAQQDRTAVKAEPPAPLQKLSEAEAAPPRQRKLF